MARANVYNQNKENKTSKKGLKITLISVVSLLVIAGIVLGTLFGLGYFKKEQVKTTYFNQIVERDGKKYDVSKFKYNTSELKNKLQDIENAFVFVYNNDEFLENNTLENYDKTQDEQIMKLIENLVVSVSEKNNNRQMSLFIVDTSVDGNEKIYANSDLGNLGENEDPALLYFSEGAVGSTIPEALKSEASKHGLEDITLSSKGNKKQLITTLKEVDEYIQKMYK